MSLFRLFDISGSGLAAQSLRLNTVASNLANADAVSGDPKSVYQARHPVFEAVRASLDSPGGGVEVKGVVTENAKPEKRYEPGNPLADAKGYVYAPRIDAVSEMTDMISASRSYQNNIEVMNTSKDLLLRTLMLGQ